MYTLRKSLCNVGLLVLPLVLAAGGCGDTTSTTEDLTTAASADLKTASPDLTKPADDLPMGDLSMPQADLTENPDLTPPPDLTCLGIGCTCQTDEICRANGTQAICKNGICTAGCNNEVPCAMQGQKCCDNQCVSGTCCTSNECPSGQVCTNNSCGACTDNAQCGAGALCCAGSGGGKSCVVGDCCANADCSGGKTCVANTCRELCNSTIACAAGKKCCANACYTGNCCSNADCSGGQVCLGNSCQPCTRDTQCGSGEICSNGACTVGCNGAVTCAGGSVCCGSAGMCKPAQASCSGMCKVGTCCSNADCPGGQLCGSDNVCRTPCSNSSQCAAGSHCCAGYCYSTACVSTLAGSGVRGAGDDVIAKAYINGVHGMVADDDGNVFFNDLRSGAVRVVNNGTKAIGPVPAGSIGRLAGGIYGCKPGPALQAEMEQPWGLAQDSSGNFYITDWDCAVIWKLSADYATVTLFAGQAGKRGGADGLGAAATFTNPSGITFGPDGFLYVSDYGLNKIRRVSLTGDVKSIAGDGTNDTKDGPATTASFRRPMGLAMDAGGTLFVGEWGEGETPMGGAVRKIAGIASGNPMVSTIVQPKTNGSYAAYATLAVGAGSKVFVPFWNNGIWTLAPQTGGTYTSTKIVSGTSAINLALNPSGNTLWIGGWIESGTFDNTIAKADTSGNVQQSYGQKTLVGVVDGPGAGATFLGPCSSSMAVDAAGNAWVADRCAHRLRKITPDGTVSSYGNGTPGEKNNGAPNESVFCYPVAVTTSGTDVFVMNMYCGRHVMKLDTKTNIITQLATLQVAGDPMLVATPPGGMVVDTSGNLYVTTYQIDKSGGNTNPNMAMIVRIPSLGAGQPSYFAGTKFTTGCTDGGYGTGTFGTWPYGLAIDAGGYLYVGDGQCGVRKVAPDGTITTLNKNGAVGVGVGPLKAGKQTLYATYNNAIWTVDRLTGATVQFAGDTNVTLTSHFQDGPLTTSKFWNPHAIGTDATGNVYVYDSYNNRVRVIYP